MSPSSVHLLVLPSDDVETEQQKLIKLLTVMKDDKHWGGALLCSLQSGHAC